MAALPAARAAALPGFAPRAIAGPMIPAKEAAPADAPARATRWRQPWLRTAAIIVGLWTLVALVTWQQTLFSMARNGQAPPMWTILRLNLASCWLWAAFTPAMMWLARRFPLGEGGRAALLAHVAGSAAFALLDAIVMSAAGPWLRQGLAPAPSVSTLFVRGLFINLASYAMVVAVTYAVDYARLYRERTVAAARLETQLADARLRALQMQLRPHFLFNTLNTIAEQLHPDPEGADRMITRLGALLRATFAAGEQEVPLRQELELLESYLEIVRTRFRDRLRVELAIDPDALDAMVPSFLLQPMVENAVLHGIEPLEKGGEITIAARRRVDTIVVEVRDSGCGLAPDATENGVGLRNTRDRLQQLYGDAQRLVLRNRVGGGAIAEVTIPYRSATGARSDA